MTKQMGFTRAKLECGIEAADRKGKVMMVLPGGAMAFVPPSFIPQNAATESEIDRWFSENGDDSGQGR